MKAKTRTIMVTLLLALSACAVPMKKQNPNVSKRPVKTSKFLSKNDYYVDEDAAKKNKKVKAEEKKETAKEEKKPEKKIEEASKEIDIPEKKEVAAEEKPEATEEAKKEIAEQEAQDLAVSDYPMDRHRRRAFSGFTKEPLLDKMQEEAVETEKEAERPLYEEEGLASWYGPGFHGRKTANGEKFNQNAMTAAHRKLPLGTMVQVTNLENGKTVLVRINDRGPYAGKRIIDLSKAAAKEIDLLHSGVGQVGIKQVDE